MNKEPLDKSVRKARYLVFACAFLFIGAIFSLMYSKLDPLSRYPYGTAQQREVLVQKLDSDQINILINSQIYPEQILPFMDVDGFNITNTLYYDTALKAQRSSPEFIVQFINQYRDRFDLNSLAQVLSWMPYADLITYFDGGFSMPLSTANPGDFDFVLDPSTTIFTWKPSDLTEAESGIALRRQAAQAWQAMKAAAAVEGIDLKAISGFVPYESQNQMSEYASYPEGAYGSREEQTGLEMIVDGFDAWNAELSKTDLAAYDYGKADQALSDEQRRVRDWLAANAGRYGFIVRYPQGKEEQTGMPWQPFVLRFVTKETASVLNSRNLSLNEYVKGEPAQ